MIVVASVIGVVLLITLISAAFLIAVLSATTNTPFGQFRGVGNLVEVFMLLTLPAVFAWLATGVLAGFWAKHLRRVVIDGLLAGAIATLITMSIFLVFPLEMNTGGWSLTIGLVEFAIWVPIGGLVGAVGGGATYWLRRNPDAKLGQASGCGRLAE